MPARQEERLPLSTFGFGSLCSYELRGEHIVGKLLGLVPVVRIHLAAIHYLRLASLTEVPALFLAFNWVHFLAHRRSVRPVYVLQTRMRHRLYLKLDSTTHFKLRQKIGRYAVRETHLAA